MTSTTDHNQNLENFIKWLREIEARDPEELIILVYSKHKVRNKARTSSAMPADQLKSVLERQGLPNELLNRIPPPSSNQSGEIEVEWQEWDNSTKT